MIICAIVSAMYIDELSQPFVKFRGATSYDLIKHIKSNTACLKTSIKRR